MLITKFNSVVNNPSYRKPKSNSRADINFKGIEKDTIARLEEEIRFIRELLTSKMSKLSSVNAEIAAKNNDDSALKVLKHTQGNLLNQINFYSKAIESKERIIAKFRE